MQGLCGGPIMPLSQTLLRRIFPPQLQAQAMGLWAMTTVVAPIAGPLLGGALVDGAGWPWVFYINVPVAVIVRRPRLADAGQARDRDRSAADRLRRPRAC